MFAAVFIVADNTPPVSTEAFVAPSKAVVVEELTLPALTATAYGVFDMETGAMLFASNEDAVLPIASVTKLFTAAKVLESATNAQAVEVTVADVQTEGRAGKLEAGQTYTEQELLFPLLLESSNDAAAALQRVEGTASVAGRMLADAAGLSANNQASVAELSVALRELYRTVPHVFDITTLPQYVGTYTGWVNNSPVYDMEGYRGGKHGYTEAAGRTLAAIFAEESLEGRELGYVVLGSENIKADTEKLRQTVTHSVRLK